MQLLFARKSPYSRRARLAVRLAGLLDQVEEIIVGPGPAAVAAVPWVTNYTDVGILIGHGPAAKVPVLITDNGTGICESVVIARYLDEFSGGKLYPSDIGALERELHVEGIAAALMDSLFVRARENRRDAALQSADVLALENDRAARLLDTLNAAVGDLAFQRMSGITLACGLAYADWRHPDDEWRKGRAPLADWFKETCSIGHYVEVFDE